MQTYHEYKDQVLKRIQSTGTLIDCRERRYNSSGKIAWHYTVILKVYIAGWPVLLLDIYLREIYTKKQDMYQETHVTMLAAVFFVLGKF